MGYGYTNGNLTSLTTPSGQSISYGYTNGKLTSITVNGSTLLSGVIHDPFGPVSQWTWGNATLAVRTFDLDGKVTQVDSAGLKTYSYDDAFRITGIADAADSTLSWTYGYDNLDRLTSAGKTGVTQGWTYDANGNRLTQTGTSASTFTTSPTSNRLASTSGALTRSYSYDNAGNTTGYSGIAFTYNNRGRMTSATVGGVSTSYVYNALGQRVKKSNASLTRYFVYDEAGHLVGEYDGSDALVAETIWFGDIPVAVLKPNGSGGVNLFYVHSDHLNTPRRITRPSDNAIVWRWDSDAFGTTAANENPSALGTFAYGLRFPGQYYDAETGLNYNYFRNYDPATGRYLQSDPIGLAAGVNTYLYVHAAPLNRIDPLGLQGFDPGPFPPDPSPSGRDPRTPWTPPAVPNRDLCEPYFNATVEVGGRRYSGLIPLVSEEIVSEDGCHKTVLCTYSGHVFTKFDFGTATGESTETTVTRYKTREKK